MAVRVTREHVHPLVAGVVVLGSVILLWVTAAAIGDDAHITFTYSRNIADGVGFVFNPGDRTLSTTTPLTAVVMAVPSALGLPLQPIGIIISVVAAIAIAALLTLNLRRYAPPLAIALGIGVVFLHPFSLTTVTNELLPYTALALWAFHAVSRRRWVVAGVLAALCTLTRPDGALVVAMVGGLALAAAFWPLDDEKNAPIDRGRLGRWGPFVHTGTAAGGVLVPWVAFATWYFGSPLPVTLRAKQAQRESGHGRTFVELLRERFQFYVDQPRWFGALGLLVVGCAVAAVMYAARRRDETAPDRSATPTTARAPWPLDQFAPEAATLILIVTWNLLFCVAYILLGVSAYAWYVVPLLGTLAILTTLATAAILRAAEPLGDGLRLACAVVLTVALVAPLLLNARDFARRDPYRTVLYEPTAEWIKTSVPPDAAVGTIEVGLIGYFSHRTIIDFAGLLQPDAATEAPLENGFDAIALEAWQRYRPEFVAMLRPGIRAIVNDPDYIESCHLVQTISDPGVVEVMEIHDCRR